MNNHQSFVIHSSYAQLPSTETISPDTRAPAIGIIVRSHNTPHETTIDMLVSMPRLSSLESGETIETNNDDSKPLDKSEIETVVRKKALEIETRCRILASELLRHAKRMAEVAAHAKVIDDLPVLSFDTQNHIVDLNKIVHKNCAESSSSVASTRSTLPPSLLSKLSRR